MRLWTLHPRLLDSKGLVAAWREGLLAQKVLRGETRGYRDHPQLIRFRASGNPEACIAAYLQGLAAEAAQRGYHFDTRKIIATPIAGQIDETSGQLDYEWAHLRAKLAIRDPAWLARLGDSAAAEPHPLFRIVSGGVRDWERL